MESPTKQSAHSKQFSMMNDSYKEGSQFTSTQRKSQPITEKNFFASSDQKKLSNQKVVSSSSSQASPFKSPVVSSLTKAKQSSVSKQQPAKQEQQAKSRADEGCTFAASGIDSPSKDSMAEIKKTLKSLMLKPRSQWSKQECQLFLESRQSPLREKLKAIKK